MTDYRATFETLCRHARETAMLESTCSLLGWDERTMMPPAAGDYRAEQMAYLAGLVHQRRTDPQLGGWLSELADSPLAADPHGDAGTTIRQIKRQFDRQTKLPRALVEELTRVAVQGQQVWAAARRDNDFAAFEPMLARIVELKRQEAEAVGYEEHPYDALLDDYEQDAKTSRVAEVLDRLRRQLVPLVEAIAGSDRRSPLDALHNHYPADRQEQLARAAAARIGFDFQRGRLDVSDHPFCCEMGPDDCRITTRYDERLFTSALFGVMHESGHGMYEQGLRNDWFGLPPGTSVSLGVHESQSRLWENHVGRSRAFWRHFYGEAQRTFPDALGEVSLDAFHFAVNDVRPSLIRVEADEATYDLHIIIRFELEQALLTGDLPVADAPAAWNAKYREYLGIDPPTDSEGVLQDIHWSGGAIGYFPTYSLGNLYAAQWMEAAADALGDLDAQFAAGDFQPLSQWLTEQIHHRGQCYRAGELAELVAGRPISPQPLVDHLRGKLGPLYGID